MTFSLLRSFNKLVSVIFKNRVHIFKIDTRLYRIIFELRADGCQVIKYQMLNFTHPRGRSAAGVGGGLDPRHSF